MEIRITQSEYGTWRVRKWDDDGAYHCLEFDGWASDVVRTITEEMQPYHQREHIRKYGIFCRPQKATAAVIDEELVRVSVAAAKEIAEGGDGSAAGEFVEMLGRAAAR